MIIDSHMHVFPALGTAPGFDDPGPHRQLLQLYISGHPQPIRRLADHALAPHAESRILTGTGREPLPDVDYRVGAYGRFEWTIDGIDYYRQFLPPSLQRMESPVEFVLQQMAYTGVDVAVLQNARLYGKLEAAFADAVRRHPGKFIGLAGVDEPNAHTAEEIAALRHAIHDLGLRGIYYANRGFFREGYQHAFDDERFEPYWAEVEALDAVIFWEIAGVPAPTAADYLAELDRLDRWVTRHPRIASVLTHGIPMELLEGDVPDSVARLLSRESVSVEVLYPIAIGGRFDYPYAEARPAIRELYRRVGGRRLLWGSDMPNVERFCTYQQSRTYLERYCDFISASDLARILGGNAASMFIL
jgi:predicted TIM-barrel fold metal-dependent hydrolase